MQKTKPHAQINLLDEIIVDGFAGGGGWSTGIEQAAGTPVDVAINHDPDAVLMHQTNHPYTQHFCESIFDVDPAKATRGRPVGWAHFSPDCKHFSKAKGGKPVDKKIRGLAWVVVRWALEVSPRILSLENVEEFQTWGPLAIVDGEAYPDPERKGELFRAFIGMLTNGAAVTADALAEWRELVAADYGAPTTRRRLFIIARRDDQPVVWPKATHAPADSAAVQSGKKLPWRSAAEIIDWTLPCPSIFESKAFIKQQYGLTAVRPLADNTMRRVMCGVDKFVLRSGRPFLVPIGYGERQGQAPRIHSVDAPLPTAVSGVKHYACMPKLAPLTMHNNTNAAARPASEPVSTITTGGQQMLLAPALIQYHTEQADEAVRAQAPNAPICTIDTANRHAIAAPLLAEYYGTGQAQQVAAPLHTIVTKDREALAVPFLSKYFGGVVGVQVDHPTPTTTTIDHNALCAAHVVKFKGQNLGSEAGAPLQTVTAAAGTFALCKTRLCKATPGADLGHWPEVRAALNRWCGYSLAEDEVLLIEIDGTEYYIADIGLRMLTARELYNANGFPPDYIIDRDYTGKPYGKSKQVARCGNAVPPPFAVALVRANWPERCKGVHITTMGQLMDRIAI